MLPSALPFKSGPLQDKKFLDKALFFLKSLVCRTAVKDIILEVRCMIALYRQFVNTAQSLPLYGEGGNGDGVFHRISEHWTFNSPRTWSLNHNSHSCSHFQIYFVEYLDH